MKIKKKEADKKNASEEPLDINIISGSESTNEPDIKVPPSAESQYSIYAVRGAIEIGPGHLDIFMKKNIFMAIDKHCFGDVSKEIGGILLGKRYLSANTGDEFIEISAFLVAQFTNSAITHLTFTHKTWEDINKKKVQKYEHLDIVGWYHTHPGFGVFLSKQDEFIQRNFFSEEWQVAYVVDPIRYNRGFLRLKDEKITKSEIFYLYALTEEEDSEDSNQPTQGEVEISNISEQLELVLRQRDTLEHWIKALTDYVVHKVDENEKLLEICGKYYGDNVESMSGKVAEINAIKNGDKLYTGQVILIPGSKKSDLDK